LLNGGRGNTASGATQKFTRSQQQTPTTMDYFKFCRIWSNKYPSSFF
jgi:hypothetical protein